jgi:hypothetical protein
MRSPERSCGSISPRFSRQSRTSAASSLPMITRASEPPMNVRLFHESVILVGKVVNCILLAFGWIFGATQHRYV